MRLPFVVLRGRELAGSGHLRGWRARGGPGPGAV